MRLIEKIQVIRRRVCRYAAAHGSSFRRERSATLNFIRAASVLRHGYSASLNSVRAAAAPVTIRNHLSRTTVRISTDYLEPFLFDLMG
jgi:hypothetical protein